MDFFVRMGLRIEELWRRQSFDDRQFPAIAAGCLREAPPASHVTYDEVADALLFGSLPLQSKDLSFGQPPIVVFADPRFYIEVLCWMDATTSIHQHAFSGAFHVMAGSSVHTRYAFRLRERVNAHFVLGDLKLAECELLQAGDTREIASGAEFIHGLFHLDRPSISVVVRTRADRDADPQYEYLPPHAGLDPFERNPVDEQRAQLLDMLLQTDRAGFDRRVVRMLDEGDLLTVYRILWLVRTRIAAGSSSLDTTYADALAVRAHERFGDRIDQIERSIATGMRIRDITRRRTEVKEPELRFFLALLMNLPSRREIDRLIAQRFDGDPSVHIRKWLHALTRLGPGPTASLFDIELTAEAGDDVSALRTLLDATLAEMLAGQTGGALIARLRRALPGHVGEEVVSGVAQLERRLREGPLAPLFIGEQSKAAARRAQKPRRATPDGNTTGTPVYPRLRALLHLSDEQRGDAKCR